MSFLNQYSYLIIAFMGVALLGFFLFRKNPDRNNLISLGALILGLLLAFFLLRPGPGSSQSVEEVLSQIGAGKPVLLQFQSEY